MLLWLKVWYYRRFFPDIWRAANQLILLYHGKEVNESGWYATEWIGSIPTLRILYRERPKNQTIAELQLKLRLHGVIQLCQLIKHQQCLPPPDEKGKVALCFPLHICRVPLGWEATYRFQQANPAKFFDFNRNKVINDASEVLEKTLWTFHGWVAPKGIPFQGGIHLNQPMVILLYEPSLLQISTEKRSQRGILS